MYGLSGFVLIWLWAIDRLLGVGYILRGCRRRWGMVIRGVAME